MNSDDIYQVNIIDLNQIVNQKELCQVIANKIGLKDSLDSNWSNILSEIENKNVEPLKNLIVYGFKDFSKKFPEEATTFSKFIVDYNTLNNYHYRMITDFFDWKKYKESILTLEILFSPEPYQFGLRGDPYLWKDLNLYFSDKEFYDKEADFFKELINTIEYFIETNLKSEGWIILKKYSHGGMSSGGISFNFWVNSAIPLLISRYRMIKKCWLHSVATYIVTRDDTNRKTNGNKTYRNSDK